MVTKKAAKGKQKKKAKKSHAKSKKSTAKKGKPAKAPSEKKIEKGKPGEGSTGPKHIDWEMAKRMYITCGRYITHEELIEHLLDRDGEHVECNVSVVHRRATKENWSQRRKEYIAGVTKQFLAVIGERYVLSRKASMDQIVQVRNYLIKEILAGKVERVTVTDLLNAIKTETALFEGKDPEMLVSVQGGMRRQGAGEGQGLEHVKKALLSALKEGKMSRAQLRKAATK